MTLKVNLVKAYDSIRWDSIWDVLAYRNFPSIFIDWIKDLVISPFSLVNLNDSLESYFRDNGGCAKEILFPNICLLFAWTLFIKS